jgi:hypothetical protein
MKVISMLSVRAPFACSMLLLSSAFVQGSRTEPQKSLGFSCLRRSFISVTASTSKRDRFPLVQLELTDPSERTTGKGARGSVIPSSRYAEIVELPSAPDRSKAIAVEVCDAEQGIYVLRVHELGHEPYLLSVRGMGPAENNETLVLHHLAQEGRTRSYKFIFKIEDRHLIVRWLDDQGQEQQRIENNEW